MKTKPEEQSCQKATTLKEPVIQINANHEAHSDWFVQIDKKPMANSVLCHVLNGEKQHILERTPNRPISFYDCNDRKNFSLRSKTIDRKKTKRKKRE